MADVVAGFRNCHCQNCRSLENFRWRWRSVITGCHAPLHPTHIFSSHSIAQLLVSSITQPSQPSPASPAQPSSAQPSPAQPSPGTCGHVTRDLQCSDSCFIFRRVGSTHWPAAAASRVPTRQKQMSYGGPDTIYDSDRHLLSSPLPSPGLAG